MAESSITRAAREVVAAELRFRIHDGTDIAQDTYLLSTTIEALKERILAEWPQGIDTPPETVYDIALIIGGRVLVNARTLEQSNITLGNSPGEVITIHAVVQPETEKRRKKRLRAGEEKKGCSCVIV